MDNLQRIVKEFKKNILAAAGLLFLIFLFFAALIGPYFSPYSPADIDYSLEGIPQPPSRKHLLGTDSSGRDILARLLYGAKITLIVGIGAVLVFVTLGTVLGAVSGYFGGWIDNLIMRIVDVLLSLPILFFILIIQMILEPSIFNVIMVIGLTGWAGTCRLVRGQVLSIREMTYIESAKVIGASHGRIIFRHIIPNTIALVIVAAALGVASTILLESALSFLGFGVQEPYASWGSMLNKAQAYMSIAPWTVIFPGILIILTVLAFNFVGDGLRDALDPKIKR